jgi:hypothetical protein
VAFRTEERVVVAFQEGFFFLPDDCATLGADEVLGRFTECMILLALIMLYHKSMAMRALPAYITGCHAMDETDDVLMMAALLTPDGASAAHVRKAQVLFIRP